MGMFSRNNSIREDEMEYFALEDPLEIYGI